MNNIKHNLALRVVKLLNLFLVTAVFIVFWMQFYAPRMYKRMFYRRGNWVIIFLFVFLYYIFGRIYSAFLVSLNRISEMIYSQAIAIALSDFIMFIVTWLLTRKFPPVWPILAALACQLLVTTAWSVLAHRWYFAHFPAMKTLIVYDAREGMEQLISEYGLEKKFAVEKVIQVDELLEEDVSQVDDYEAVYLCGVHSHDRNIILKRCVDQDVCVYVIPRIGDVIMSGARNMHMFHLPVLRVDRYEPSPEYIVLKRLTDIVLSGIAVIITSPIMLVTALLIRRDGGPVLYRQVRLTKDGREFEVLKFRSMRVDAEKDGVARLSSGENDDRITPVGRVIRSMRIDELPQMFNILKGDMSIVGPRPERPEIAAQYEQELPEFRLRLQAKAGLTGMAQVYGKYNTTPYDKLMMDLMYIAHPSMIEDLRLMLYTVKILFMPESTEGVAAGQVTAADAEGTKQDLETGSKSISYNKSDSNSR